MKKIILHIWKEDILATKYTDIDDNAIDRSLKRHNYPDLRDSGVAIVNEKNEPIIQGIAYNYMITKVIKMYCNKQTAKDIYVELQFNN